MHIFNISQSHTTQLQNKPAHLPCPYRLPPDSCAGSMTGVISPAQCMPGHHKRAEAHTPKRVQVSGPDEEKKCLGNKGYSHPNFRDYSVPLDNMVQILPTFPPLGSPSRLTSNCDTNLREPQLKIRVTNYFYLCTSLSSNITPHCSEAQLTEKQNLEFRQLIKFPLSVTGALTKHRHKGNHKNQKNN